MCSDVKNVTLSYILSEAQRRVSITESKRLFGREERFLRVTSCF